MNLYLKIDQDEASEFFEKYDTLSPLRKKIWNKITQKARSWPAVYAKQEKIAEWCGCSRSAVSEAFRLFREWGWISLFSRGWKRSKTLCISHSKRQIDVVNRQYFKRVEATHRATHTYSTIRKGTGLSGSYKNTPLEIPKHLKDLNIPEDIKLKLAMIPIDIYLEQLRIVKEKSALGFNPDKPGKYLFETCRRVAEAGGYPSLNWRGYYAAKQKRVA